jgi:serine/threonine protein kinase
MLEFNCPSCGRRLSLDETWAGKKCRCSACNQILVAPQKGSAVSAAAGGSSPSVASRPALPPRRSAGGGTPTENSTFDQPTILPDHVVSDENAARASVAKEVPAASGPAAAGQELIDFLAPAESPDELGRLGGYRILQVLGAGGMGVVFQAEELRLKRMVALKTMLPVLAVSAANRQRFQQEAETAAAIEHDNIITIYQVGEDRGVPFIAMPLLQGESLETRLKRAGRLSVPEVLRVARETAGGLAVAHGRGLIHRDIKPSNLWLEVKPHDDPLAPSSVSFRVKILDFGLARSVTSDSSLTRSGTIIGTPAYMAPEQARGQAVDGRCDLFSLGCVLYHACTGQQPFRGTDTLSTLLAVTEDTPPPPHQLNPQVPPSLSELIMMLLAKEPSERPSSARTLLQVLPHPETVTAQPEAQSPARPPIQFANPTAVRKELSGTKTLVQEIKPEWHVYAKWVLAAGLLGGGLGLVLLILVGIAAYFLVGKRSETVSSSSPPLVETAPPDVKAPKGPPNGAAALDPQTQTLLRDAVQQMNYARTNIVGFPHGTEFTELPSSGALLIGFEVGLGQFGNKAVIHSLRPIFLNDKGEFCGQTVGQPTTGVVIVKAKQGYAVGAVALDTGLLIDGMLITFMRVDRKFLDREQSYQEKVAGFGQKPRVPTLGGGGDMVLGVYGRTNGKTCHALGLIVRGKGLP